MKHTPRLAAALLLVPLAASHAAEPPKAERGVTAVEQPAPAEEPANTEPRFGKAKHPFVKPHGQRTGDTFPVYVKGRWHVFNMNLDSRRFGHISSDNLIDWKEHPQTPFGGCTGTVVPHEGRYYMFFTGPGQAVSLAVSDDLDTWRLHNKNPILKSDGKIYQHGNFRDPYVFYNKEDKCWWLILGARQVGILGQRSGCVALAKSPDLYHWKLEPPLWAPQIGPHTDCPQLLRHKDRWYLIYLQRYTRFRTARSLSGPWQRGENRNLGSRFAVAGSRPAFDGRRWINFPVMRRCGEHHPEGKASGTAYGGLTIPRQYVFNADGTIGERVPEEIVTSMHRVVPHQRKPLDHVEKVTGDWTIAADRTGAVSRSPSGGTIRVNQLPKNFYFQADLVCDTRNMDAHIVFNTQPPLTSGYLLEIAPDEQHAILRATSYWDGDPEMMRKQIRIEPGKPIEVQIFRTGTVVDIFVGDAGMPYMLGRHQGGEMFLEFIDGSGRFENIFVAELTELEYK